MHWYGFFQWLLDVVPHDTVVELLWVNHIWYYITQEAQDLLSGAKLDPDASTRGQQKKLDEIAEESSPAKKPRMAKGVTMAATAKVNYMYWWQYIP